MAVNSTNGAFHSRKTVSPDVKDNTLGSSTNRIDNNYQVRYGGNFNATTGRTTDGDLLHDKYNEYNTIYVVDTAGNYMLNGYSDWHVGDLIISSDNRAYAIPVGKILAGTTSTTPLVMYPNTPSPVGSLVKDPITGLVYTLKVPFPAGMTNPNDVTTWLQNPTNSTPNIMYPPLMNKDANYPAGSVVVDPITNITYTLTQPYVAGTATTDAALTTWVTNVANATPGGGSTIIPGAATNGYFPSESPTDTIDFSDDFFEVSTDKSIDFSMMKPLRIYHIVNTTNSAVILTSVGGLFENANASGQSLTKSLPAYSSLTFRKSSTGKVYFL